ncbi:nitroreductase family protein [Streptobacillus felis]|uniref:nitroreductase family protein n=1 Tax=Streptobacillus felis TaxID=1384509 RepID=UPI00082F6FF1|nr:nitroreductase family protein [Streptobacillus felis]
MSNEIIKLVGNRKSVRNFSGGKVSEKDLELIMKTVLRMPNSRNLQQLSFVVVQDKEKIQKLAEYCGKQKQVATADAFVIILGDYSKFIGSLKSKGEEVNENIFSTSVIANMFGDAGIAASTIDLVGNSLGYGSTIIGGVFSVAPLEICKLLKLPKHTFPLLGVTLGVPEEKVKNAPLKPRTNFDNVVFFEEYDESKAVEGVVEYDEELNKYWESIGVQLPSHLDVIKSYLSGINNEFLTEFMKEQGFKK